MAQVPNATGFLDTERRLLWRWLAHLVVKFLRRRGGKRAHLVGTYFEPALVALSDELVERARKGKSHDLCVVTGDLATMGESSELRIAKEFFEGRLPIEPSANVNPAGPSGFIFDRKALVLLPGNHDRYKGTFLLPGGEEFEGSDLFGDGWELEKGVTTAAGQRVRVSTVSQSGENLFVIAVDFSHLAPSWKQPEWWKPWYWLPCSWLGRGTVDPETLGVLRQATRKCQEKGAVIWAMHFVPKRADFGWSLGLYGGDQVIDAAIEHGVSVILTGHTHKSSASRVYSKSDMNKSVRVVRAGSVCATLKLTGADPIRNSFLDLRISVSSGAVTDVDVYRNDSCEGIDGRVVFERSLEALL